MIIIVIIFKFIISYQLNTSFIDMQHRTYTLLLLPLFSTSTNRGTLTLTITLT